METKKRVMFEGRGEKILVSDEKGKSKAKKIFLKLWCPDSHLESSSCMNLHQLRLLQSTEH